MIRISFSITVFCVNSANKSSGAYLGPINSELNSIDSFGLQHGNATLLTQHFKREFILSYQLNGIASASM